MIAAERNKWMQHTSSCCKHFDDEAPEVGVGVLFEPSVRWLQLYIKSCNVIAVISTLLRIRARFHERLNLGGRDWGPMSVVSQTQKCHLWFPCVLHSLLPVDFLDAAVPVSSTSPHIPLCEAVVQAAHLARDALDNKWSADDVDVLMKELLGCNRCTLSL
jgi:hypothetical protein